MVKKLSVAERGGFLNLRVQDGLHGDFRKARLEVQQISPFRPTLIPNDNL